MMKKTSLVAGLVLVASLVAAPVALAQDTPPQSCAEALVALHNAQTEFDETPATVVNPELAALQAAVAQKQAAVDAARPPVTQLNPQVYPDGQVPAVEDVDPELLQAILDKAAVDGPASQLGADGRAQIESALRAFTELAATQKALDDAPAEVSNPAKAAATKARDAAKAAADKACTGPAGPQGAPGENGADGKPAPKPVAPGFSQVGAVPSGGVQTGGGPA